MLILCLTMNVMHGTSKSARYSTYPYLQDGDHGGTLKRVYWVTASQNY